METEIKYKGYIDRQLRQVEQQKKMERRRIPEYIDYAQITGMRLEAREKLAKIRPDNIGQAMRISGVSAADISVLAIWMESR